jgi:hypothetical protein
VTKTKPELILWIAQNRGLLSKIAKALKPAITPQYVSQIARGQKKSKDGGVERKLRESGWPME